MKGSGRVLRKQFYMGNRWDLFLAVLCCILLSAVNIFLAWLIQQMIDTASGVPGAMDTGMLGILILGTLAAVIGIKLTERYAKPRYIQKAMLQYRNEAYRQLMKKNIAAFSVENTADYLSAFSNDTAVIEKGYLETQFDLLSGIIVFAGSLLLMLVYSPLMTLISCAFFLLPAAASLAAGNRAERAEKTVSERNGMFTAALKDILSGFSVIKTFRAEEAVRQIFEKENRAAEDAKCRRRRLLIFIGMLASAAGVAAQMGTFFAGVCLADAGAAITPGVLIAFVDLTGNIIGPIQQLPEQIASRRAAAALTDRLAEALGRHASSGEGRELTGIKKGITLRKASFGYNDGMPVLRDLSMVFEAGKSYAVVGASGSGKSTLLHLLMGARNGYTGAVLYDGCEVREIGSASLYGLVSLIQQNVFVFNASIRDNITMFRSFPEEDIRKAEAMSGLTDLIREKGEMYCCGENGSGLSGGEKQRISIARSLLGRTEVLLADEVTASLDPLTSAQVQNAILGLKGILRIVVTHDLDASVLRRYDGIVAMKNGRIAESGTFEELMDRREYFYSLFTVSQQEQLPAEAAVRMIG